MSTQEGLPAKLELAQAYFQMGDASQAEMLLQEVMQAGSQEQRMAAKALLQQQTPHTEDDNNP